MGFASEAAQAPSVFRSTHPTRSRYAVTQLHGYAAFIQKLVTVVPPSTTMVWPVMKLAASEHRNTAAPAISCGRPQRLSAVRAANFDPSVGLSTIARLVSVAKKPGAVALTVIPCGPSS